jgi:hypothetical protein
MANKARRNRRGASADPEEIKARTGVAPAPGEVVSRKTKSQIDSNAERAKKAAENALAAMKRDDYSEAGKLFKVASDAANLANAHKMRATA